MKGITFKKLLDMAISKYACCLLKLYFHKFIEDGENITFYVKDTWDVKYKIDIGDFDLDDLNFSDQFIDYCNKVSKNVYGKVLYISDFDRLEKFKFIENIEVLNGDGDAVEPPSGPLASVDTKYFLSESVLDDFWNYGGLEAMEEDLSSECPYLVVTHYKGKSFDIYHKLFQHNFRIIIPIIDVEKIATDIFLNKIKTNKNYIKTLLESDFLRHYDNNPDLSETEKEEYENSLILFYLVDQIDRSFIKPEEKCAWLVYGKEIIDEQVKKAVSIIEKYRDKLIFDSNLIDFRNEFLIENDLKNVLEEKLYFFIDDVLENLEKIKMHTYEFEMLENNREALFNELLSKYYIKNGSVFEFYGKEFNFIDSTIKFLQSKYPDKDIKIDYSSINDSYKLNVGDISLNVDLRELLFGNKLIAERIPTK